MVARSVVERKLAGCANIFPGAKSFFLWEGAVKEEAETIVIFKTQEKQWIGIRDAIKNAHPYEVPVIASIPMKDANANFLEWLDDQVS